LAQQEDHKKHQEVERTKWLKACFVREFLDLFWSSFFLGVTLRDYGCTKPGAQVARQFIELGVAVDFDGLLSGVANHVAVVAPGEMVFQFSLGAGINDSIQVVG
jgi:hypothetical protein